MFVILAGSNLMRRACSILLTTLLLTAAAAAQDAPVTPAAHGPVPVIQAARATGPIVIDGRLDDEAWLRATPATAFIQRDPEEGKPVSEETELRVAYDDRALYVGARLRDREPSRIARQLARRDQEGEADGFSLYLDPHHDHLTGAMFSVSAAGVQSDATIFNDSWNDGTWDAVWESATRIDEDGWVAEMRIPFSQLRFPAADRHTFGINAMRYIQRKNERAWLVHVPKKESGLASRLGHLEGLEGVSPRRTFELLPYVVSRAEFIAPSSDRDPFNDGARMFAGTGIDLKYRFSSNLSLDGTINPDFGQVEVDPAVVNLTAFETFFEEKRPFFIEGANIFGDFGRTGSNNFWGFNRAEPLIFYSRRIGRSPQGSVDAEFVDTPTATTILGAAKVTGKTRNGWSLGTLEAVTGREYAITVDDTTRGEGEVEPLSNYFVGRAQREIGRRAAVGVIATAVNRDLREPSLRETLPAQSYVAGVDGHFYLDAKRDWVINGRVAGSYLRGSTDAITRVQQSSQRYFDRPDASYVELDPAASDLDGWTGSINLNRQSGVHLVNAALWGVSPGFDSSDAGFTFKSDRGGMHAVYQWRDQEVKRFSRQKFLAVAKFYTWNYGREVQADGTFLFGNTQFKNYWRVFSDVYYFRATQNDTETRGGPSMLTPESYGGSIGGETDSRKRLSFGANFNTNRSDFGGWRVGTGLNVRYRPAASLEVSVGPGFDRNHTIAQYVGTFADPVVTSTYGSRYVFGLLRQRELSIQTRVNYVLSPKMSLQVYMQPLVSVGDYEEFKELARPRTFDFIRYGQDSGTVSYDAIRARYTVHPGDGGADFEFDDPDFNFKSLRLNAIFRWEWRPGSAMYFVWTEQREDLTDPGRFHFGQDIGRTFQAPADDVLMFKIAYWFQR
jgi:Domain of unknown function (DUF5916)/Carbohydrate family 9 binding domain-like